MSGRRLGDITLREMLPSSIRNDKSIASIADAFEGQLSKHRENVRGIEWLSKLDELTEPMLSSLAYQWHMTGPEGWALAETDEQKRSLLKDAFLLHQRKGTRWAIERVLNILEIDHTIVEWWQPTERFKPYTFDVKIENAESMSLARLAQILEVVFEYKNLRSGLRRTVIENENEVSGPYVGGYSHTGVTCTSMPHQEDLAQSAGTIYITGFSHTAVTSTSQEIN